MFQDEARFGRIGDPRKCRAPALLRPIVKSALVREYVYAYAAISPQDGVIDWMLGGKMDTVSMGAFLRQVSHKHPEEFVMMVVDGAPFHRAEHLRVPKNMVLVMCDFGAMADYRYSFRCYASYTRQLDAEVTRNGVGSPMKYVRAGLGSFGIEYNDFHLLNARLSARYLGSRYEDNYFTSIRPTLKNSVLEHEPALVFDATVGVSIDGGIGDAVQ